MNNYHIILKQDGLYLADLPDEVNEKYFSGDQWKENQAMLSYEKAEDQAIKDTVKLKDQLLAKNILFESTKHLISNKPSKWDVNWPYKVDLSGYDVTTETVYDYPIHNQVAILTPKKDNITSDEGGRLKPVNLLNTVKKEIAKENSVHSFISYFHNEKGDCTITLDDEPIAICENEEAALKLVNSHKSLSMRVDVLSKMLQPSVTEESQEDLWREFEDSYLTVVTKNWAMNSPTLGVTKAGKEEFILTRKPKKI